MKIKTLLKGMRSQAIAFSIGFVCFAQLAQAQVYTDNTPYTLVPANNGGDVRLRDSSTGSGNIANIRSLCDSAGLPTAVRDSRLTVGEFASNITQMAAVTETLQSLANQPATYTGSGTVVNNSNLEQHRAAIAGAGGTFIFRGTVNVSQASDSVNQALAKLIQVGPNTTIWVDGTVQYLGPVIPGTVPDEYSVSDVINGIFEVVGANGARIQNASIFGTKRGLINTNDRLAAVYSKWSTNLVIEGLRTDNCRNVMFLHNVDGASRCNNNFIYDSTRRAIHLKVTPYLEVKNNLIFNADVDGIDIDAWATFVSCVRNVIVDGGSRWQVWAEVAASDNLIDGNVGIHVNETDGGFQENGSETIQPPTARNTWQNNHVFYADSASSYKQGFSFHPSRNIDRPSITFTNNFTWQTNATAYKNNPKEETTNDVSYYFYNGPTNVPVTGINVTPATLSRNVGATGNLSATFSPSNATNQTVTWSTSNASVATVNSSGVVTAVSAGSATITGTTADGGFTDTCAVTVTTPNVPVTGVTVTPSALALNVGATGGLAAAVSPSNATNENVSWSTSNASVATVSSSGVVSAVSAGSATITATTADGGFTDTCAVAVSQPSGPNAVQNSGLETGDLSSWSGFGTREVVANPASGAYAVKVTGAASHIQVVTVSPNTEYTYTAKAKVASGSSVLVGVKEYGGSETNVTVTSTSYTATSVTFTTGPGNTTAKIYFYVSAAGGVAYGDDFAVTANAAGLPSPWQSQDIGSVGAAGEASHAGGVFTIEGSGADIWGTSDAFQFVYQSASGNCSVVARVASVENTNAWAKAGVMIRETLDTGSKHAMVVVTPGQGVSFQRRVSPAGSSTHTTNSGLSAPYWVRITRSGSTFTAERSTNGTSWTTIGSETISMGTNVYIGLAVTSHDDGALATATFENVTATP